MLQSMGLLRVGYNLATEQQQQSTKHKEQKIQQKADKIEKFPAAFLESVFFSSNLIITEVSEYCRNSKQSRCSFKLFKSSHYLWDKVPNPQYASYSCHGLVCRLPFTSLKALCSSLSQDIGTCYSFCLKYFDTETIDLRLGLNAYDWDSNPAKTQFGTLTQNLLIRAIHPVSGLTKVQGLCVSVQEEFSERQTDRQEVDLLI